MVLLTVTLLGGFEARLASGATLTLPKKAQGLLAYLGVRSGEGQPRDKLASLLWGEKSGEQARDGLRHALAALRRALGSAQSQVLRVEGQALALDAARVQVDAATFERQLADGAPPALEQAAALYRGDFLLGFTVNEPLFEEWLVGERERLREMALAALARLLAHQSKAASTERAIQTAVRLLGLDPLQEAVHRTLMRLYARQGRRGAALKQYQACVGALRRELGTEPEAETRELYQELIRRGSDSAKGPIARGRQRIVPAHRAPASAPELPAAETPLFGRETELGRLRQLLERAMSGHGHVATVFGEAGIGKTRLVTALATEALARGCRVLIGRCHESASILPYGLWVDACRTGEIAANEEVVGALSPTQQAELARLLPEAARADLPRASDSALPLFDGVAQLIQEVAAHQPLLLVLEDLHWADEMSLRLLAYVRRRIPTSPALLVATVRDEELADASMTRRTLEELAREPDATSVALSALSRSDTVLLVRALARVGSETPMLAHLEKQIWAMSEGNPFVAVELVRALDQRDRKGDARQLALPASVRDLVARRLDGLGARSQELAAIAAVIGRRFDFTLLHSAGVGDEREAAEAVEELVRRRVFQAVGNELDFTHDRIRSVASGRLLPHRRQLIHRSIAEALEARFVAAREAPGFDDQIEQLAYHALHGGLPDKAVHYLLHAGRRAAARSALHDGRARFEQALRLLEALPETPSTLEQGFEVRLGLRSVLTQLGEFPRILEVLREAEVLAERLNDDHRRGRVAAFLTNIHARLGEPEAAITCGTRALEIGRRLQDVGLRVLATTYLEQAHYYRGEYARVVELARDNLAAVPPDLVNEFFGGAQPPAINDRGWLLQSLAHLGEFVEAAELAAEAIRLAESTHHAYTLALACQTAAAFHSIRGDWPKAKPPIERALAVLRAGTIVDVLPLALAYSARILAYLGETDAAMNQVRENEQLLEGQMPQGRTENYGYVYQALGRALLCLGRPDEAARMAERALASAAGRIDLVPQVRHLLGDIASRADRLDPEQAETHYRAALAVAESRGTRPLIAHCHLGLGTLYGRVDQREPAALHLAQAAKLYRDLDMRYWLDEAETARAMYA
jgi:DNA-binding SARP family transcriptional activator